MSALKSFSATTTVIVGVLLLSGCESPELEIESEQATPSSSTERQPKAIDQPPPKSGADPVTEESSGNEANLGAVFGAWESGAKDEAVSTLLKIDWESPMAIGDIPIMGSTERAFSALSQSERGEQQSVAMKLASSSKAILRHAFSLAEQAEEEGDNAKAELYYEAVQRLGNTLAGPERLTALQMMGESLVQMADEKLAAQK